MAFEISIPGFADLRLQHLVLDYNGTLAYDGELLPGVERRLRELAPALTLHVLTADTFGAARSRLQRLPCTVTILPAAAQAQAKRDYVDGLGAERVACIGNGSNDRLMLQAAALGIAVVQGEGASAAALAAADIVASDVCAALDLFVDPRRLLATLRE